MISKQNNLIPRSPIVVVMGHIDHGKSKLLDFVRKTSVVESEAGGITQHMGAYETEIKSKKITFIDTPGHEAFSHMRVHGAKIADVAVLVVAADEGPKPQTIEAYNAIKDSNTPFAIALNKTDKPNADPERTKGQLAENQIFVEGYGGTIPCVNISAKTGEGINELLDIILLLADMEELKGNPDANASGFVIESNLSPQRGISATLIIRNGALRTGMFVVAEDAVAQVKIFEDFQGKPIKEAIFSSPVKIIGFDKMPANGAEFKTFDSKKEAEANAEVCPAKNIISNKISQSVAEQEHAMQLIVKTDFLGSLEALEKEILKIKNEKIALNIVKKEVGNINEIDAQLASSVKNPIILGFNVEIAPTAKDLAERHNVKIFISDIIYKISEWLEEEIKQREKEMDNGPEIFGIAKVLKTFSKNKSKQVLGGQSLSGRIHEGGRVKIKRGEMEIGDGKIRELQRNKAQVKEINEGDEFGAMIESKADILAGDEILVIG